MKLYNLKDRLGLLVFWSAGIFLIVLLISILGVLFLKGYKVVDMEFLTDVPKGLFLGSEGGILPAIIGSLGLVVLAMLFSVMPALCIAIYLVEYIPNTWLSKIITFIIQAMVGIPSILTGLFGYSIFVVKLNLGISLLAGGLTLAIMIFPMLVILMRDALNKVDNEYRLQSLVLGVSRRYIVQKIILPKAIPHICSSFLLGVGYAAGATAPIMITAVVILAKGDVSLLNPVMALPYHLYILFSHNISVERAYGVALVLVAFLLTINLIALYIQKKYQGEAHD